MTRKLSSFPSAFPHGVWKIAAVGFALAGCEARDTGADLGGDTLLSRLAATPTIGKSYAQCIQPIGYLRGKFREAGTRDGIRLRVANVSGPVDAARVEIGGEDAALTWASVTLVLSNGREARVPRISLWAYSLLSNCGADHYTEADDDWLDSSYAQLVREPGTRTRDIGPRRVTLSREKDSVSMLLTVTPRPR